jgi:hypothetical protein
MWATKTNTTGKLEEPRRMLAPLGRQKSPVGRSVCGGEISLPQIAKRTHAKKPFAKNSHPKSSADRPTEQALVQWLAAEDAAVPGPELRSLGPRYIPADGQAWTPVSYSCDGTRRMPIMPNPLVFSGLQPSSTALS